MNGRHWLWPCTKGKTNVNNVSLATALRPVEHGRLDERTEEVLPLAGGAGRVLDVAIALVALLVAFPFMAVIGLMVYASDRGPVVYAHRRIGRGGREFHCLKFRSMVTDSEERLARLLATDPMAAREWEISHKLRYDPRITRFGRFLRKSSFDELPQIWNVLKGEMSIVGPRPIVRDEIVRYGRYFDHYCAHRPGITGLWQISGRSNTNYRRRVALDVAYSRSKNVLLDMRIIAMTVPAILLTRGAC